MIIFVRTNYFLKSVQVDNPVFENGLSRLEEILSISVAFLVTNIICQFSPSRNSLLDGCLVLFSLLLII